MIDELEKKYLQNIKDPDKFFPLIQFIINNNDVKIKIKKYNTKKISEWCYINTNECKNIDDRIYHTYKLIDISIKFNKNKKIINTILLIWISDRFPWYLEIDKKLPIYVYAKPKNTNFLLFPDTTFYCLQLYKKYNGDCNDFDIVKKQIIKNCTNIEKKI